MKKRTRGRELALQLLYQIDLRGDDVFEEVDEYLRTEEKDRDTRKFAKDLIVGTREHVAELNEVIKGVAQNWEIGRMAVIDRNVLRLATYELLHCGGDVPPKVAINEAIELGKRFSTQNSGAFINGILDKIKSRFVDGETEPVAEAPTGSETPTGSEAAAELPLDTKADTAADTGADAETEGASD